jgi:hypothetical protein
VVSPHVRDWLPDAEHVFQSLQVQVSTVQTGGGGVQVWVVAELGVMTARQSTVNVQVRA